MKYTVKIAWGDETTRENNPDSCDSEYEFGTQAELDAFLLGVSEVEGWLEYEIVSVNGEEEKERQERLNRA